MVSVISKLIEKADFSQITLNNQSVKLAHVTLSSLLPDENDNISELILTGMQEACVCILIKVYIFLLSILFYCNSYSD